MLGISLHGSYLTFAAVTEEGDSRVIDQTGVIDYPFPLTKKDLVSNTAVQDLIGIFRDLRDELEFPQNKSRISLTPEFVSIQMGHAEPDSDREERRQIKDWESSVRVGNDTFSLLKKQHVFSDDDKGSTQISVYFYPKIIENIMEAAEFARLGVTAVDINPFAAYETVRKNYDLENYERHSLIHFDADSRVTLSIYDGKRFLKYARFAITGSGPVFYSSYDAEIVQAARKICEDAFDNVLYQILGPVFVYADRTAVMNIYQVVRDTYFMELINPFVNYRIFNKPRLLESDDDSLNDNIFVEVAGTLFRGNENHDKI